MFRAELKLNTSLKYEKIELAAKRMNKKDVKEKGLSENIKVEKAIMKSVKSEFITEIHSVTRDQQFYYIFMELAQLGDLFSFIKRGTLKQSLFFKEG